MLKCISSYLLIVLLTIFSFHAGSEENSFVTDVQKNFIEVEAPKAGLEVEVQGLNPLEIAKLISTHLGGNVSKHTKKREVETNDPDLNFEYKILGTALGNMRVESDDNSTSSTITYHNKVSELVTAPLYYLQIVEFQKFLIEFKKHGALGTEGIRPISTQLTIDFFYNTKDETVSKLIQFLRIYFNPENNFYIKSFFNTPKVRQTYIGSYSKGMLKKIMSEDYQPSAEQFFFDFLYRQVLEFNGYKTAWSMDKSEATNLVIKLTKRGLEPFLKAVKWNDIKISSLLIYLFPEDPLSKFLFSTSWIKSYPAIEFREGNTDFNVLEKYLFLSGLIQMTTRQDFDFKRFQSTRLNMCEDFLKAG